MSSTFGRKRKNSDSSMHVSRDVRRRPATTCSTPPTTSASISISSDSTPSPFDDKTDLLIEILLHTDKSNILYTRSAADLTQRFKSVRLGFQQLSDYLLSKGIAGEKMDELMDVMEPAMGAGITTVLSQDAFRPNTIMAMIQSLVQVGQDKFGSDFGQTAQLLLSPSI